MDLGVPRSSRGGGTNYPEILGRNRVGEASRKPYTRHRIAINFSLDIVSNDIKSGRPYS